MVAVRRASRRRGRLVLTYPRALFVVDDSRPQDRFAENRVRTVAAAAGSNYSVGDLIEIVVGDSTYGTASIFRRIETISTDTFTFPLIKLEFVFFLSNSQRSNFSSFSSCPPNLSL